MILSKFGLDEYLNKINIENEDNIEIGRVCAEHKEKYTVVTEKGEFNAEITGNLRFSAESREDFPVVGDWVAVVIADSNLAIIHEMFPRYSHLSRQAVGKFAETQVIASNIDYAFLVQAVDRDFNINRLERYLTLCSSSKVHPVIILTKIDLINNEEIDQIKEKIKKRIKNSDIFTISNYTKKGYNELIDFINKGKTYCMLGSSGVGKSTLLNNLSGKLIMKTDHISESNGKGRHVSTHRELFVLENGGILIDNPGMREVGISDSSNGVETVFDQILEIGKGCKFKDCTHTSEKGCKVIEALENNTIDRNSYDNYLKIEKEKIHFELSLSEKRKKDKSLAKIVKNYKRENIRNKY